MYDIIIYTFGKQQNRRNINRKYYFAAGYIIDKTNKIKAYVDINNDPTILFGCQIHSNIYVDVNINANLRSL